MPLTDQPRSVLPPWHLNLEEIQDPFLVIEDLFQFARLPEIRELMQESLDTMVTGGWHALSARESAELVCLHRYLEKMVEACHLLLQQEGQ